MRLVVSPAALATMTHAMRRSDRERLLQKAEGYVATIKSGAITFRDGEYLRVHPGRLIRGPQTAPMNMAAE